MEPAVTTIRPPRRWPGLGLRELAAYRELVYFLTKRELQVRYKQSVFGISWAILQPVAYAFVFAIFFGSLANVPSDGVPYPLFALAALVPWIFASQGVGQASASLVNEANLLGKVYFPRLALPLSKVISFLIDLLIGLAVLGVFIVLYSADPTVGLAALPLFLALAFTTAIGAGLLLATLNVRYRDVTVAIPLLVQLWLFATPVLYPGSLVEGAWEYVYAINPMVSVIEGVRWGFVGTDAPSLVAIAISFASASLLLAVGLSYFRSAERYLADII
jgi:lipopolysaccharide transport system permease protein